MSSLSGKLRRKGVDFGDNSGLRLINMLETAQDNLEEDEFGIGLYP